MAEIISAGATRPRNVDWKRAAALLYGDWGTSKAYVTGIAFAIAMYSSFWFVLAISILTMLVGFNYHHLQMFSRWRRGVFVGEGAAPVSGAHRRVFVDRRLCGHGLAELLRRVSVY